MSKFVMQIFDEADNLVTAWENFVTGTNADLCGYTESLEPYNARFISHIINGPCVEFESEKDYMLFVLKWS